MSTGYGWEGIRQGKTTVSDRYLYSLNKQHSGTLVNTCVDPIWYSCLRQVRMTLLGACHVPGPELLCGGSAPILGALYKCSTFTVFTFCRPPTTLPVSSAAGSQMRTNEHRLLINTHEWMNQSTNMTDRNREGPL